MPLLESVFLKEAVCLQFINKCDILSEEQKGQEGEATFSFMKQAIRW